MIKLTPAAVWASRKIPGLRSLVDRFEDALPVPLPFLLDFRDSPGQVGVGLGGAHRGRRSRSGFPRSLATGVEWLVAPGLPSAFSDGFRSVLFPV